MHYYSFNIGDYRKDTTHLSPIEHYIYRSLIDWYYLDEKPIPAKTNEVLRRLGLGPDGLKDLQNVLDDFFQKTHEGWSHGRIESELAKYTEKKDSAKQNGRKGGRPKKQALTKKEKPKKTQSVFSENPTLFLKNPEVFFENPTITEPKPNHKPITNNQEPETNNQEPITRNQKPETTSHCSANLQPQTTEQPQLVGTPKSRKTKIHSSPSSPEDVELANFFWQKISILAPNQKRPNLKTWAEDIRKMREIDKRTMEEIRELFVWANRDSFWQSNIRSPKKLREKFDQLNIKRKSNGGGKSAAAWDRAIEEAMQNTSSGNTIEGEFSYE